MRVDKIINSLLVACVLQALSYIFLGILYQLSEYKYNFIDIWMYSWHVKIIAFTAFLFLSPWLANAVGGFHVGPIKFIILLIKNRFMILVIIVSASGFTSQVYAYISMKHSGAYEVATQYILHDEHIRKIVGEIKSIHYKFWSAPQDGRSVYVITDNREFFITIDMIKDDTGTWRVKSAATFSVNPLFKHTASGQLR